MGLFNEELAARACYESARAFLQTQGKNDRQPWDKISDAEKQAVIQRVQRIKRGELMKEPDWEELLFKNMVRATLGG